MLDWIFAFSSSLFPCCPAPEQQLPLCVSSKSRATNPWSPPSAVVLYHLPMLHPHNTVTLWLQWESLYWDGHKCAFGSLYCWKGCSVCNRQWARKYILWLGLKPWVSSWPKLGYVCHKRSDTSDSSPCHISVFYLVAIQCKNHQDFYCLLQFGNLMNNLLYLLVRCSVWCLSRSSGHLWIVTCLPCTMKSLHLSVLGQLLILLCCRSTS